MRFLARIVYYYRVLFWLFWHIIRVIFSIFPFFWHFLDVITLKSHFIIGLCVFKSFFWYISVFFPLYYREFFLFFKRIFAERNEVERSVLADPVYLFAERSEASEANPLLNNMHVILFSTFCSSNWSQKTWLGWLLRREKESSFVKV